MQEKQEKSKKKKIKKFKYWMQTSLVVVFGFVVAFFLVLMIRLAFLSGEDDPCMKGEKGLHDAASLMYVLGYHNVTAAFFTKMRHEILNEKEKQIVWDDILDFLEIKAYAR